MGVEGPCGVDADVGVGDEGTRAGGSELALDGGTGIDGNVGGCACAEGDLGGSDRVAGWSAGRFPSAFDNALGTDCDLRGFDFATEDEDEEGLGSAIGDLAVPNADLVAFDSATGDEAGLEEEAGLDDEEDGPDSADHDLVGPEGDLGGLESAVGDEAGAEFGFGDFDSATSDGVGATEVEDDGAFRSGVDETAGTDCNVAGAEFQLRSDAGFLDNGAERSEKEYEVCRVFARERSDWTGRYSFKNSGGPGSIDGSSGVFCGWRCGEGYLR